MDSHGSRQSEVLWQFTGASIARIVVSEVNLSAVSKGPETCIACVLEVRLVPAFKLSGYM